MKCVHVGCAGVIDTSLIARHAESYGGSICLVSCPKCKKGVRIASSVIVKMEPSRYEGPKTTGSWGDEIPASLPRKPVMVVEDILISLSTLVKLPGNGKVLGCYDDVADMDGKYDRALLVMWTEERPAYSIRKGYFRMNGDYIGEA